MRPSPSRYPLPQLHHESLEPVEGGQELLAIGFIAGRHKGAELVDQRGLILQGGRQGDQVDGVVWHREGSTSATKSAWISRSR